MTEAPSANHGPALKARYRLRERLGSGGQGEVWRAHDAHTDQDIALKILHPAAARRAAAWAELAREHDSVSRLEHPAILKLFPPERDGDGLLLPMELAPGGDLRRLRGAGYLAIVPVLLEIAQALEHAHERGVIHGDLKPGNVLFDARGRVKLADFGAAARPGAGGEPAPRALSPFSASPEQLRGEPPAPADDVYGLGALAYELLSRYPPHYPNFEAGRVQREPVPPLEPAAPMPPRLGALIARMLAKEARERPATMREVMDELDAALNDTLSYDFEAAEAPREARPAAPAGAAAGPGVIDGPALWKELRQATVAPRSRLEPMRSGAPRVLAFIAVLAAAAFAAFFWLPHLALSPGTAAAPPADAAAGARLAAERSRFGARLAALEGRGAGVWGGADFAAAKTRAAESVGAYDAGSVALAQQRLGEAGQHLEAVEQAAPAALAAQLAAGEHALAAGQQELALQAFDLAARIAPQDERATLGQSRARRLAGVLPLLADAANAQAAQQYQRATQDYMQALALDPKNAQARAGLARASAASSEDSYARAAGEGFVALGAGHLEEARAAFERARRLRPDGMEALEGLQRVAAAGGARGLAALRAQAAQLEAQERWDEALRLYEAALSQDRSLAFAQAGRARANAHLQLGNSMQSLIDRPERLASPQVRSEALALLEAAQRESAPGPALRAQIARLGALLPEFDRPVHLSLVSDSRTQVAIPSVGVFGAFTRRDIELKPGHYIVIGTRDGYRDVRRDITVSPGQRPQTVSVSCSEAI